MLNTMYLHAVSDFYKSIFFKSKTIRQHSLQFENIYIYKSIKCHQIEVGVYSGKFILYPVTYYHCISRMYALF